MQIIKPGTRFDFVAKQKPFIILSILVVLASAVLMGTLGLNFGVDFKGGSEIIVAFKTTTDTTKVREATKQSGFEKADVQTFGSADENRFLIRIPRISLLTPEKGEDLQGAIAKEVGEIKRFTFTEEGGDIIYIRFKDGEIDQAKLKATVDAANLGSFEITKRGTGERSEYQLKLEELQGQIAATFLEIFGEEAFSKTSGVERVETVGPRVGQQLRDAGILSILIALLFILIYIAFRFDVRFAPGAVVALFHDVVITLGIYAALQMEVNLPIIAALLTIVGYSLNDTIVIFDRIRENFANLSGQKVTDIVNISINDSLSRTLLTSVTTLIAVIALYILGGGLIQNFAFALIVGVIVGTYSSTFVASPILIFMHEWIETRKKTKATLEQAQSASV